MAQGFDSVDDYVAAQPPEVQVTLDEIRRRVLAIVPEAQEVISYQIPAFKVDGKVVIYVAAWKHHISVYPVPDVEGDLREQVERHRTGKGTLRFPLDQPFPFGLLERLTEAALAQLAAS